MYRFFGAVGLAALLLSAAACGSGYGPSSTSADGASAPPTGAVVIDVIGVNGARSFSPNPATVPAGQTVVWHNVDAATHRVVLDDRGIDTGDIAPGRFSAPMALPAPGPYHCTIHPSMVGTIAGDR